MSLLCIHVLDSVNKQSDLKLCVVERIENIEMSQKERTIEEVLGDTFLPKEYETFILHSQSMS